MKIPGSLPVSPAPSARVTRAYGLPARPAAPAAAPAGKADTQGLRAILSDEERAYFDQLSALGPISYAPGRRAAQGAELPRGLRLDVTG